MNTSIFLLRAKELNLSMQDLEELEYGDVIDMLIERQNDDYDWPLKATQDDIDKFANM